jgi:hypothetical protein
MNSNNPVDDPVLAKLAHIMRTSPKGSAAYKKAMKELDKVLGMPSELSPEGDESYDDGEQEAD